MSKIKKITVGNLKAVSSMSADFDGCTAIITGGNNKGKSSFLKSLPERLRGNKSVDVLKHGEKDGFAEWELTTGEKFIWEFNDKKEKLTFISERNIKQSVTKDLCTVYFPPVFDVDEFLNSTPKKQKETLQKLTGIDFLEFDRMYKAAYDDRTHANRMAADEKIKCAAVDPDLPSEEESTSDIEKELNGIEAHDLKNDMALKDVDSKKSQIKNNLDEIEQLEKRIADIKAKNSGIDTQIETLNAWLVDPANAKKENASQLQEQISQTKETNKLIAANNLAIKQKATYLKWQSEADELDKKVKQIEAEKLDVIKNSSMPDGFSFSDEGITYQGFDFNKEQLSSSGIYIATLKLAALNLGEVKALHFDASFLDKNSLLEIEKWATENDLQLLIERPDFEGGEIHYELLQETV